VRVFTGKNKKKLYYYTLCISLFWAVRCEIEVWEKAGKTPCKKIVFFLVKKRKKYIFAA